MKSPAHRLIAYLLLKHDVSEVEAAANHFELLVPSKSYITKTAQYLMPPKPLHLSFRHQPSARFFKRQGIEQLVRGGPEVHQCFRILDNSPLRERIEAWTIAGAPTDFIERTIRNRGYKVRPGAIDCYLRHFFNVRQVSRSELRKMCDPLNDARTVAARLPAGPSAMASIALALGDLPGKADLHAILSDARTALACRTLEAATDERRNPRAAQRYATALEKVCNSIEHLVDPGEEVKKQMASLQLRSEETKITLISDLDGEATTELVSERALSEQPIHLDEAGIDP